MNYVSSQFYFLWFSGRNYQWLFGISIHKSLAVKGPDSDSRLRPAYTELTVSGHSYKLADLLDYKMQGFVKTPDGSAIVFIAKAGEEFQPMMAGTLHVVNLKTKSYIAVPLGIHWSSYNPKMSMESYDGHQLVMFVDPNGSDELGGDLVIDLDAKRVTKFDRTKSSVHKSASTP